MAKKTRRIFDGDARRGPLTQRDLTTLRNLDTVCRDGKKRRYVTPMMLGASDASYHSKTLRKLFRRGLVERKERGGWTKTSWQYCITPAGIALLKERGYTG